MSLLHENKEIFEKYSPKFKKILDEIINNKDTIIVYSECKFPDASLILGFPVNNDKITHPSN